jgi:hypothetical protein
MGLALYGKSKPWLLLVSRSASAPSATKSGLIFRNLYIRKWQSRLTMNSNSPGGGHDELVLFLKKDFVFPLGPSLRNNKTRPATDSRSFPVGNVYKFLAHRVIGRLPYKVLIGRVGLGPLARLI